MRKVCTYHIANSDRTSCVSYYKKRMKYVSWVKCVNIHTHDGTHIPCVVVVSKPRMPWQVDCYVVLSMIHRHITRNQFKVPFSTASALANSQIDPIHARNICEAKMGKLSRTILEVGVIDFPKSQIRRESPSCTYLPCNLH